MADLNTTPVKEDRELAAATANAVSFARSKWEAAQKMFGTFRAELEAAGFSLEKLTALGFKVTGEKPVKADVDRLVTYAKEILAAAKPMKLAADQAAFEAEQAEEEEGLEKLSKRIQDTLQRLERVSDRLENADELREKLMSLTYDLAEGKADVKKGFGLCNHIDGKITNQNLETVIFVLGKVNDRWLLNREGQTGRLAKEYRKTGIPQKVANWLERKPAANAKYADKKAYIREGWELKDLAEAPWGHCTGSVCEGKGALTPNRDGKIQPKCGKCYHASSSTNSASTSAEPKLNATREISEMEGENLDGISFNGVPVTQLGATDTVKVAAAERHSRRKALKTEQESDGEEKPTKSRGGRKPSRAQREQQEAE